MLEGPDVITPKQVDSPSEKRLGTERDGLSVLLGDKRMQCPDLATKKLILELLLVSGAFKPQTFDAVMTTTPTPTLTVENAREHIDQLTLVEMKTTRASIRNASLNAFFFGATDNEFQMAKALKSKYVFAFVVLNDTNDYGRPFFVLLTLEQLQARTRTSRIQYQINFRNDMPDHDPALPHSGLGFETGSRAELASEEL